MFLCVWVFVRSITQVIFKVLTFHRLLFCYSVGLERGYRQTMATTATKLVCTKCWVCKILFWRQRLLHTHTHTCNSIVFTAPWFRRTLSGQLVCVCVFVCARSHLYVSVCVFHFVPSFSWYLSFLSFSLIFILECVNITFDHSMYVYVLAMCCWILHLFRFFPSGFLSMSSIRFYSTSSCSFVVSAAPNRKFSIGFYMNYDTDFAIQTIPKNMALNDLLIIELHRHKYAAAR